MKEWIVADVEVDTQTSADQPRMESPESGVNRLYIHQVSHEPLYLDVWHLTLPKLIMPRLQILQWAKLVCYGSENADQQT